jgi:predicted AlkP superfamily phosphohydrolase/phosphomutase
MREIRDRFPTGEMLATGVIAGLLYFTVNLIMFFPHEQLSLMGSSVLKANLFVYSLAVWILGFTALAALLFLVTHLMVLRPHGRGLRLLRRFIVYFVVTYCFAAGMAVWGSYGRSAPLLARYAILAETRNTLILTGIVAACLSLVLSLVVTGLAGRPWRLGRGRVYLACIIVCFLYVAAANLAADRISGESREPYRADEAEPRVVILGVDAGSWNVLLPFIEEGALPTFRHMMDSGTYGYFDTYGPQFTPPAWASIATGKKLEKHNVYHFGNLSSDWEAAPIWSIMSAAGRSVAVVNWVCTWPPFEVDDVFITKITSDQQDRIHLSGSAGKYASVADSILATWEHTVPDNRDSQLKYAAQELSILLNVEERIVSNLMPDLISYYYYSPDMLQHFLWKDMDPEVFAGNDWADETSDPAYANAIRDVWTEVDEFLSELMATYGDDAYYFVISDHGARPIGRRQVTLDMTALLVELGYAGLRGGEIHRPGSVCYLSEGWSPHYRFDIQINPAEYMNGQAVDLDSYKVIQSRIVSDLEAVSIGDRPVFEWTIPSARPGGEEDADIMAFAARVVMERPGSEETFSVNGRRIASAELLRVHPWSGRHRARGILLAAGPAIRHGYTGAWTMDDGYATIFRHVHGIYQQVDRFASVLRRLHLIDQATTLDFTPTLLYMSGLPVAEDMDGRILTEMFDADFKRRTSVRTVSSYGAADVLDLGPDADEEQKIRERLKALGYIQ